MIFIGNSPSNYQSLLSSVANYLRFLEALIEAHRRVEQVPHGAPWIFVPKSTTILLLSVFHFRYINNNHHPNLNYDNTTLNIACTILSVNSIFRFHLKDHEKRHSIDTNDGQSILIIKSMFSIVFLWFSFRLFNDDEQSIEKNDGKSILIRKCTVFMGVAPSLIQSWGTIL